MIFERNYLLKILIKGIKGGDSKTIEKVLAINENKVTLKPRHRWRQHKNPKDSEDYL